MPTPIRNQAGAIRDTSLITLQDVHLTLASLAGPVNVLKGISLDLDQGEAVGLIGPSGSGKSTLLMVIAGLEKASRGQVRVSNHDLSALDEDQLAQFRAENIGIVFQSFHLIPTMTALENVAVPLELMKDPHAMTKAKAQLERVGLGQRLSHFPGQLSGGEQQRVALARAFVTRPRLLLADEPTGNLDQDTGHAIMDLLFELHDQAQTTLVLITHDPDLAARCQRQIRIENGHIAHDSGPLPQKTPQGAVP